jgi:hypothetical protein
VRFSDKNAVERCKPLIGCLGVPFFIVGVSRFQCRRGFSDYRGNHRKNCLSFLDFSFSASTALNRTKVRFSDKMLSGIVNY